MADFPLQEALIDAVVEFANAKRPDEKAVRAIFRGTWKPDAVPSLATCRKIQTEVRQWLLKPTLEAHAAAYKSAGDNGIVLKGHLGFRANTPGKKPGASVTWSWGIERAPLRALCGLAVMSIEQAASDLSVGVCRRKECGSYFIDRTSRGTPREYCLTDNCNKARNRERVNRSRSKP